MYDQLINQSCPFSSKVKILECRNSSSLCILFFSRAYSTCAAQTTFRNGTQGGPASKSHFSHISLEKHLSPRLIMNKNKKQVDILILIYSDFTLIFFLFLFPHRKEDECEADSMEEGWGGPTAPLPPVPITWSQFQSSSLSRFLSCYLSLLYSQYVGKKVDFAYWSAASFLQQAYKPWPHQEQVKKLNFPCFKSCHFDG